MHNLFQDTVAKSAVDNLEIGTLAQEMVRPVELSGSGAVKRGTLLTTADGVSYAASPTDIFCVLLLDADLGDPDEGIKPAAFGGQFNQSVIEEIMGVALDPLELAKASQNQLFIYPANPDPTPLAPDLIGV